MTTLKRIGLIVNPIAGMGGRVGLKGTDGAEERATGPGRDSALRGAGRQLRWGCYRAALGGHYRGAGTGRIDGSNGSYPNAASFPWSSGAPAGVATGPRTRGAARRWSHAGVDLLLFAGGDGTARDIYEAAGNGPPVLGIPTGVKMHSAVYATTPRAAGEAAATLSDVGTTGTAANRK